ncbi:hypothetical protein [Microbacterium lacticum]|uniref:hypothetical protein n=1 Tax=Microbacterium lacticum TaxID=33885 RepID=UPI0037CBB904
MVIVDGLARGGNSDLSGRIADAFCSKCCTIGDGGELRCTFRTRAARPCLLLDGERIPDTRIAVPHELRRELRQYAR